MGDKWLCTTHGVTFDAYCNYRPNPPASRVTALAGHAPRRRAGGLSVALDAGREG